MAWGSRLPPPLIVFPAPSRPFAYTAAGRRDRPTTSSSPRGASRRRRGEAPALQQLEDLVPARAMAPDGPWAERQTDNSAATARGPGATTDNSVAAARGPLRDAERADRGAGLSRCFCARTRS
jgi:hypothetical protein